MAIVSVPAFAQGNNCLGDVGPAKSCSANDVRIANVIASSVNVFQGGFPGTNKCLAGSRFSFTADFEILTTSNKARSNIGIFMGTGQNNALHGTCTDSIIAPPHPCAFIPDPAHPGSFISTATCGSIGSPTGYEELDQAINGETGNVNGFAGCGDTSSTDNTTGATGFGAGTQSVVFEVDGVTCPLSGDNLPLPFCTSWYQPTSTMPVCESPAPNYPWQPQAIAGTSSKCDCGIINVPVQPVQPSITVAKGCDIVSGDTTPHSSCTYVSPNQEGGTVTYTVTISNTTPTNEGGVIIDQICDDQYGQIYPSTGTCAAGKTGGTVTFGGCTPGFDIPNGNGGTAPTATCTFTVSHGENLTVTDTASVTGHSDLQGGVKFGPNFSSPVTVTSTDFPTTATTSKGIHAPHSACITVTYVATVNNTSSPDESITLKPTGTAGAPGYVSALNDPSFFGDITVDHGTAALGGSVTGTTCGVAAGQPGKDTLSGYTVVESNPLSGTLTSTQAPGGAFPETIAANGSYSCYFDGVICGTATSVSGCSALISQQNQGVVANLFGDDAAPNADTIGQTDNSFTANICLVPQ
jgi:hypothetical protein